MPARVLADGVSAPVPGSRRPGTVVVFLEVIAPQPTLVTSTTLPPSTPVAVDIDCGAFGTRRLRATTDPSGAVAFTSAAPIEVLESTRCGVRAVEGFSVPPEWKSRLTVSGHDVNLGDSVSLPAPAGEQTIVAVRMSFTASSAQENTGSNTVTAGRELAPRNEISGENALGNPGPGSAAIPVPVGPQPLPAPTQLILGATFSLGLVLAALAARRTVST